MFRRFVVPVLAIAPLVASCSRSLAVEPRLVAVQNALAAVGYTQSGALSELSLGSGDEARVPVDLESGECRTFIALGSSRVRNVDIVVYDQGGNERAHDESHGRNASVEVCVGGAEHVDIAVRVTSGGGEVVLTSYTGAGGGGGGLLAAGGRGRGPASAEAACGAAQPITPGRPVSGNTQQGGDFGQGSCVRGAAPEVYHRLELTQRSSVQIRLESSFDGAIYVLARCGDLASELACNDDDGDTAHSSLSVALDPGTYYVVVDGYAENAGAYDLRVEVAPLRPVADVCAEAQPLAIGTPLRGTTAGSVDQFQSTCAGGARSPDRVHRLAIDERARVRIHQRTDTGYDGALHVRSACEDAATEIACNDDFAGITQSVVTGIYAPGTYYVVTDGYSNEGRTASGAYSLEVQTAPADGEAGSVADACGNAGTLAAGDVTIDTMRARDDFRGSCGGQGGADVVYRVRVTSRSHLTATVSEAQFGGAMYVRRACADGSPELACAAIEYANSADTRSALEADLEPGEYFLVFDGLDAQAFGSAKVSVALTDVEALTRAAERATMLRDGQSVQGNTTGNPDNVRASCGNGARSPDAVYRFRLTRRSYVELELSTPGHDGVLHVRREAAVQSSELACNDDASQNDTTRSRVALNLDAGTYYVYVDGFSDSNAGAFTLRYSTGEPRPDLPPQPRPEEGPGPRPFRGGPPPSQTMKARVQD